jgi:hypothetical protein
VVVPVAEPDSVTVAPDAPVIVPEMLHGHAFGAIVMLNCCVAVWGVAAESVTCTVNVVVPDPVGVPVICPALESVSPAGKLVPFARDQVSGGEPPFAASVAV